MPKGSHLLLNVTDDHMVSEVIVSMFDAQGGLLEEGTAKLHDNDIDWVCTTQKQHASISGRREAEDKLRVSASDLPGNKSEREAVMA